MMDASTSGIASDGESRLRGLFENFEVRAWSGALEGRVRGTVLHDFRPGAC